jgi:hypothetical protein
MSVRDPHPPCSSSGERLYRVTSESSASPVLEGPVWWAAVRRNQPEALWPVWWTPPDEAPAWPPLSRQEPELLRASDKNVYSEHSYSDML